MSDILDIRPALKRKRMSACVHPYVEVDEELPSLTCAECEAEIDPWWFIRRQAEESDNVLAERTKAVAQFNEWAESANATLRRLNEEIQQLTAAKNHLWNEKTPDGRLLGQVARRARKRA